jgi:hypothetical protein
MLADPQIHTTKPGHGNGGNLGEDGFKHFFSVHHCNDLCRAMKLAPHPHYRPTKPPPAEQGETMLYRKYSNRGLCPCGYVYLLLHFYAIILFRSFCQLNTLVGGWLNVYGSGVIMVLSDMQFRDRCMGRPVYCMECDASQRSTPCVNCGVTFQYRTRIQQALCLSAVAKYCSKPRCAALDTDITTAPLAFPIDFL